MKNIISVLVIASLIGCGQSRSQVMSNLVKEQKLLKDSLTYATGMEAYFTGKAKGSQLAKQDTLQWHQWSDSATSYFIKGRRLEEKVTTTSFSIDSLSKMK